MTGKVLAIAIAVGWLGASTGLTDEPRGRPVPVSPGSVLAPTMIANRCPTFSWGDVPEAESFELRVYRLPTATATDGPEGLRGVAAVSLPGGAHSWSPDLTHCLEPGGQYAWTLRAITSGVPGEWSEASLFEVAAAPAPAEVEEALALLRDYLRSSESEAETPERSEREEADRVASVPSTQALSSLTLPATPSAAAISSPPPRTVTPPGFYDLSIEGDVSLGGSLFRGGSPFMHTDGSKNTALGYDALISGTTANNNTAFGYHALRDTTSGGLNTAVGTGSLERNTSGFMNTAIGNGTLATNTEGFRNTAVGHSSLPSNSTGDENTAMGMVAMLSNTTGNRNTAIGIYTLHAASEADDNTAVGAQALRKTTTGFSNSALGSFALYSNTIGSQNTAVGHEALHANTEGTYNTAVGYQALQANTTGMRNTAVGDHALASVEEGLFNVAIGYGAGGQLTTGSNNIFVGHYGIDGDSYTIRIGISTHAKTFIHGIRGKTTTNADATAVLIDSAGQLGTVSSSRRTKREIRDIADASDRLLDLRPVTFRYKAHGAEAPIRYGLIAEEVAEVLPELVVYDDGGQPETVLYHLLAPMLLNELQEARRMLEDQQRVLDEQQRRLDRQDSQLRALSDWPSRRAAGLPPRPSP